MNNDPVREFNDLLSHHAPEASSWYDELQSRLTGRGLLYAGQPIPTSLRPRLLTPSQHRRIQLDSTAIATAAAHLEAIALEDPRLMTFLGLPADELEVIRYPSEHVTMAPFSRLDGFLHDDRVVFVEFNIDSPGGAAFTDEMATVFLKLPVVKKFQERYRLSSPMSRTRILNVLVSAYRGHWGQHTPPQIAIVDWADVGTAQEFVILKRYFESQGYRTMVVDPSQVTYRNRTLWHADFRIDIAYKRVVTRELLDRKNDCRAFLQACKDGTVCLMNPFRVKLQTVKAMLAAMWDDRWLPQLSRHSQENIRRCIPWTARVERRTMQMDGKQVDLPDYIVSQQHRLVMKPNDEYGGAGVTLGWTVDAATWADRLKSALATGDIVQEKVELPTETFPVFSQGKLDFESFFVDCDPYFFEARMGTVGTRFSTDPILNVKTGGGAVPTFVATPR